MLTVLRKGNTLSVFPMCSYFCAKCGYCVPRVCKAGPGCWPRQPYRFGFFPVVLGKPVLHQHLLCLLKWKPRQLNNSDLSFMCGLMAGSQGLAWALVLTFMSQVSLAKVLCNQMAGLPGVGSICYCHCYLFYFLLPVHLSLPCAVSPCVRCYLPSSRPFQLWTPFQKSSLPGTVTSRKTHNKAGSFLTFLLKPQFFREKLPHCPT